MATTEKTTQYIISKIENVFKVFLTVHTTIKVPTAKGYFYETKIETSEPVIEFDNIKQADLYVKSIENPEKFVRLFGHHKSSFSPEDGELVFFDDKEYPDYIIK